MSPERVLPVPVGPWTCPKSAWAHDKSTPLWMATLQRTVKPLLLQDFHSEVNTILKVH